MMTPAITFDPITYADIPGWGADDHLAAWRAFVASCSPVVASAQASSSERSERLAQVCALALMMERNGAVKTRAAARSFFETHFRPYAITAPPDPGLLTGYYEPLLKGSRVASGDYRVPIYRRPGDLVNVVAESERGAKSDRFTHLRRTADGLVPYLTRAEIEQGGLAGQGLELMYFKDTVDVFFMQIQGSGWVELPDGKKVRITYDGKNGYPYTSVGRVLIDRGVFRAEDMSLKVLGDWLRADRKRGATAMWKNESYVFFRELEGEEAQSAMGVLNIPLQTGRSLAVDTAHHALGLPIFVSAPRRGSAGKSQCFNRLMIAHDVGSAIKGAQRGDIFFGSGARAGKLAGVTKHAGRFFVLLPNEPAPVHAATGDRP